MNLNILKEKISSYLSSQKQVLYDIVLENVDGLTYLVVQIEDVDLKRIVELNPKINELVDKYFDKYYDQPYILDVTSAGINRELKTIEHKIDAIGSDVIVETKNKKFVSGELIEVDDNYITIATDDEDIQISTSKVVKINLNV